ncbi:LamG-like jellyroll fold domain-containing protein [Lentimicrobium sp. S6]|uniref:LamG-like jellyroll fold domain-containing protein n=1 Tax=Lentimicrobium sp. S6 TaxID=2735872 RepID=UPI0015551E0B|nr:LamG-like jellyroll fold domain-containing protein [Lentimicrobium sp. S6]NPD47760.1 T9SS type A sorting domain-containing protein [Lentimicrobium sp. S6]
MKSKYFLAFFFCLVLSYQSYSQNNALEFDGIDDYVQTSYGGEIKTLEFWFKTNSFNTLDGLFGQRYDNVEESGNWQMHWDDNGDHKRLRIYSYDPTGGEMITNTSFESGQWYHVAITSEVDNVNFYINGVHDSQHTWMSTVLGGGNNDDDLTIGGSFGNSTLYPYDGELDEVRVWSDIRTESEIRQNMYQELPNPSGETNLVAYYKLNETSGTTVEDSKGSFDGTLTNMGGNEWQTSPAMFGPKNCLDFDGNDDYVTTGAALVNLNDNITIEAMFNTTNADSWNAIATIENKAPEINNFLQILTGSDGKVYIKDAHNIDYISTTESYNDGIWHQMAFIRNAATKTIYLYVDGELKSSGSYTSTATVDPDMELRFGNSEFTANGANPGGSYFMDGMLDEIRIWNDVRTEEEIRVNMCKSLTGNETGLLGYFTFDNTSGTTLQDFSGNGNDGTLTNMTDVDWVESTAFNTWLNTNSTSWATVSNWSRGSVPSSTDNVHIENLNNVPSNSSDLTVNNLVVAANSSLDFTGNLTVNNNVFFYSPYTIYAGDGMTVDGDFFYDDSKSGSFTIKSGGSLITNNEVTGSINIERTIAEDSKWHLISVPNSSTTTTKFINYFLQQWDEPTHNWQDITDLNIPMVSGKGYSFFDTPDAKTTFSFSGTPNNGEMSYEISSTATGNDSEGFNLVGNPYPSSIDWNTLNETYGAIYLWNPEEESGDPGNPGDYIEWNGNTEYGIAPMQGFFIFLDPNKSLNFIVNNDNRTHDNASTSYKSSSSKIENGIVLSTNQKDQLKIRFLHDAADDFDYFYDAFKIVSLGESNSQFYSKYFETKLAIDCRPETEMIQLGYQNNQNGQYSIEMIEINGITQAEIEDTKQNTFHNLSQGSYQFDWETTDSEERFILHLKATATDELVEQEAQVNSYDGQVYIHQTSSNEYHTVHIYDIAGRVVYTSSLGQEELQSISLSNAKGAYLVQLVSDNEAIVQKVILK